MKPDLAVVTLTHNKLACTRKCLTHLLHSRARNWELIVVDNGSSDGTPAWLQTFREQAARHSLHVSIISNPNNIGCSTARNQGAAQAADSVRHLVFIDNDVTVRSRDWLNRLAAELDADETVGMVGPKLVYPFHPHPIQCAGGDVTRGGRVVFRGRGEARRHPEFNQARDVQCLISACCMIRRPVFEQAGGFDTWFHPVEYEDIDLCYRIRHQGYRVRYLPDIEMYHFENVTTCGTRQLPNTYLIIRNGLRFKKRWQAMYTRENGPPDTAARWRRIDVPPFETINDLALID